MRLMLLIVTVIAALFISGCSSPTPPDGVTVVQDFNTQRYLGKWYEIARFDHAFERGLERVTATYSLRDDGGLTVVNRGYNTERGMWQQATGTAYFTGDPRTAALKVSFFGPFYGQRLPLRAGLRAGPRLSLDIVPHAHPAGRRKTADAGHRGPTGVCRGQTAMD